MAAPAVETAAYSGSPASKATQSAISIRTEGAAR
jgi:hypothetical protein